MPPIRRSKKTFRNIERRKPYGRSRYAGPITGAAIGFDLAGIPGAYVGYNIGKKLVPAKRQITYVNNNIQPVPIPKRAKTGINVPRVRVRDTKQEFDDMETNAALKDAANYQWTKDYINSFNAYLEKHNKNFETGSEMRRGGSYRTPRTGSSRDLFGSARSAGSTRRVLFGSMTPKGYVRRRKFRGVSTTTYTGKFKKTRKLKKTTMALALAKGYHTTEETYGTVEDRHCVYVTHSTWKPAQTARTIAGALLRKLFLRAGCPVANKDQEITSLTNDNSEGWRIRYVVKNPINNATAIYVDAILPDNRSLKDLFTLECLPFVNHLIDYIENEGDRSAAGRNEPYKLELYYTNKIGETTTIVGLASQIWIMQEHMKLSIKSDVKLQNRSAGSQASADDRWDLDRVDNVPIAGFRYNFTSGDPRLKAPAIYGVGPVHDDRYINRINVEGLNVVLATQMWNDDLTEPPNGWIFANCNGKRKVLLQPGEMKKGVIKYELSGKFLNVLHKLRCTRTWDDPANVKFAVGCLGRSEMYCFEEKIHTDATNKITVQYERQIVMGCVLKTTKMPAFTTDYVSKELSNPPE